MTPHNICSGGGIITLAVFVKLYSMMLFLHVYFKSKLLFTLVAFVRLHIPARFSGFPKHLAPPSLITFLNEVGFETEI